MICSSHQTRVLSNLSICKSQQTIHFLFFISRFLFLHSFYLLFVMTFFDQFAFSTNDRQNNHVVKIVDHVRKQQFAMWMNFYEIIILFFHFANSTRTTFKRFLNDVINIVNNVSFKKRDKKIEYRKNVTFASQSLKISYNFIFFESVVVRFRQKIRRFARFANRAFSFFQFLFQEENDDHEFDDFFFIRLYSDFVDHESNQKFEHASNQNNDEKKNHVCSIKEIKKHTREKLLNNAFEFENLILKFDVTTKIWISIIWSFARKTWCLKNMYCLNFKKITTCVRFAMFINTTKNVTTNFSMTNIDIVASTTKFHSIW